MQKKNIIITLSVISILFLALAILQYNYKILNLEFARAYDETKPQNGHAWSEMQCSSELCVTSSGVGIGTDSPTFPLQVNGTIVTNRGINFGSTNFDSATGTEYLNNYSGYIGANYYAGNAEMDFITPAYDGGSIAFSFIKKTGSESPYSFVNLVNILRNGNVGIGTTAPTSKLHIYNAGDVQLRIDEGTMVSKASVFLGQTGTNAEGLKILYDSGNGSGYINTIWSQGNLFFGTVDTTRMMINYSGYIGMGTTSPTERLRIYDTTNSSGEFVVLRLVNGRNVWSEENGPAIAFNAQDGREFGRISVRNTTNNGGFGYMAFTLRYNETNTEMMRIAANSYVGIGTTSPSYKLHVNGTAYATGAAGSLSDIRHKTDISTLDLDALDIVSKLNPVEFQWINPLDQGMEGTQIGFIAQEVETILPEVVLTEDNEEGTKALKYDAFIPILTKAVQELTEINERLEKRVEELENCK